MSTVVSTRISKKDKKKLKEAGIDISGETRRHLEQIAANIRAQRSVERLNKAIEQKMPPAKRGFAQRSVHEDRERN